MQNWKNLNINQKIQVKQHAINHCGKRWHTKKPNSLEILNELQIHMILN